MSNPKLKVSQMSIASTIKAADFLMLLQDGVNKKVDISTLLKNLNSSDTIRVNATQNSISFSVSSKNDANAFYIDGATDRIGVGTNTPQSKLHVAGNIQIGSSTTDGVVVNSTEDISYTASDQTNAVVKSISPTRAASTISCGTGVNGTFIMPSGVNGQIKTIIINTLNASNTANISIAGLGFTTITGTDIGQSITLQYITAISKWCILNKNGMTTA